MIRSTGILGLGRLLRVFEARSLPQSINIHTTPVSSGIAGKLKGEYVFPESNADVEISTAEWPFVERYYPMKFFPKPNVEPGTVTPSGWIAPSAKREDNPYYVARNRSHELRVHKNISERLNRVRTMIKGIEGDVFALGRDLEKYLLPVTGKRLIIYRVSEPNGTITFKDDLVNPILDFCHQKGF